MKLTSQMIKDKAKELGIPIITEEEFIQMTGIEIQGIIYNYSKYKRFDRMIKYYYI